MLYLGISKNYATALLSVANQEMKVKIGKNLSFVSECIERIDVIKHAFCNKLITMDDKVHLLMFFLDAIQVKDKLILDFLRLMVVHSRIDIISEVSKSYHDLLHTSHKSEEVTVTTSQEIDTSTQNMISDFINSRSSKLQSFTFKVDPKIIKGIIINTNGGTLDYSISNILEKVKRSCDNKF